jgi:hypothetical protein
MKMATKINRQPLESLFDKGKADEPPIKKRYRISLRTVDDVKRLLSVTLNEIRRGDIDVQIGRALIYGSQVLLNVFEQSDLEQRIRKLEELTAYGGQR